MREITLGQYYPANSPVHKLDPRIKLILVTMYIVMVFYVTTFFAYGVIVLFVLLAVFCSRVPLKSVLKSIKPIFYLVIFTVIMSVLFYAGQKNDLLWRFGFIKIYKESLISAAKMALRLILVVLGTSILTLTTTPVELTDAIERLLKPLTYIKVPVHTFAIIMSLALRLIPSLIEETDKIIAAQKARCADFESGNLFKRAKALLPILIPLFVSSFRRADELANAIDSRCYRGAKGRTRLKVLKLKFKDFIALFIMIVFFVTILFLRYNWVNLAFIAGLL